MMGLPYSMVSNSIPTDKRGVYMGIINMMIVIPKFLEPNKNNVLVIVLLPRLMFI